MPHACTLICPSSDFDLTSLLGNCASENESVKRKSAKVAIFVTESATAKFTLLLRKKPGDEFSHLVLSLDTRFRGVRTKAKKNKQEILNAILNAKAFIGIAADPNFDEVTERAVFGLAEVLGALVFTGDALLNGKGQLVLDTKGKFATA